MRLKSRMLKDHVLSLSTSEVREVLEVMKGNGLISSFEIRAETNKSLNELKKSTEGRAQTLRKLKNTLGSIERMRSRFLIMSESLDSSLLPLTLDILGVFQSKIDHTRSMIGFHRHGLKVDLERIAHLKSEMNKEYLLKKISLPE